MSYNSNANIYSPNQSNDNQEPRRTFVPSHESHQYSDSDSDYDHQNSDFYSLCANCGYPLLSDDSYGLPQQKPEYNAYQPEEDYYNSTVQERYDPTKPHPFDSLVKAEANKKYRYEFDEYGRVFQDSESDYDSEYDHQIGDQIKSGLQFDSIIESESQNSGTYGSRSFATQTPIMDFNGSRSVATQTSIPENCDRIYDSDLLVEEIARINRKLKSQQILKDMTAKESEKEESEANEDSLYYIEEDNDEKELLSDASVDHMHETKEDINEKELPSDTSEDHLNETKDDDISFDKWRLAMEEDDSFDNCWAAKYWRQAFEWRNPKGVKSDDTKAAQQTSESLKTKDSPYPRNVELHKPNLEPLMQKTNSQPLETKDEERSVKTSDNK